MSLTIKNTTESHDRNKGFKLGVRHHQAILVFICYVVVISLRTSLSVSVLAMTEKNNTKNNEVYDWDKEIQGYIFSSNFWGNICVEFLAGPLVYKYGAKTLLAIGLIVSAVIEMFMPTFATVAGWKGVCACITLQGMCDGFFEPCIYALIGRWAPLNERARFVSFIYSGYYIATILSLPISAVIGNNFGWKWIFYSYGIQCLIMGTIWIFYGSNEPSSHKTITEEEKLYIKSSLETETVKGPIPWKSIFTSKHYFSLVIAQLGIMWGVTVMAMESPIYFKLALGMDLEMSGLLTSFGYAVGLFLLNISSYASDFLQNKGYFSTTTIRKLFNTVGTVAPGVCLIFIAFIPANYKIALISTIVAILGLDAINSCGYLVNYVDISPQHAGVLISTANWSVNCICMLAPIFNNYLIKDSTDIKEYRKIFWFTAFMYIFTNIIYIIFGTAEKQKWDSRDNENDEKNHVPESIELVTQTWEKDY